MENKTIVSAENGKQEIRITRVFDLPVDLLFKAYTEAEFLEQWMGTKVIKLETKNHGAYQFVTTDPKGNKHGFNGVIHVVIPNQKITRTFEMENGDFGIQLEFLEFDKLTDETSELKIHTIFRSVEIRDQLLKLPFSFGINMAHNKLEDIMKQVKGE